MNLLELLATSRRLVLPSACRADRISSSTRSTERRRVLKSRARHVFLAISSTTRTMAETGYDPKRSKVSDDKLAEFIRSAITGDVTEVPGIAARGAEILAEGEGDDCVTNTYQLIGKYLALRGPDKGDHEVDSVEHCDKFWYWLQSKGINSNRSGIVNAIAEKVNTWMPGIYDADSYTA